MAAEDRFKQSTVLALSRRAANRCSNPACQAITSGPSDCPDKAVNVGEAAHIYGANPGSARYDSDMATGERSSITNAIWLCANCHKIVDDDPGKYPAGLLFEWQREHERIVSEQVGKAGAEMRHRYEIRHLEEFGRLSYRAERILLEKDDLWEFRLTSEILRFEMQPVLQRWRALSRQLYMKPMTCVSLREFGHWLSNRMNEARNICEAFSQITNFEFNRAWGEIGVPGDETEIVATCRLFAEMCSSALAWEEEVRFVSAPDVYDEVVELLKGVVGSMIDEAAKLPRFMAETFGGDTQSGSYAIQLTLALPDGWAARTEAAMEKATNLVIEGIRAGDINY